MTRFVLADLCKGFLLGVVCTLGVAYAVKENGSRSLAEGKFNNLVNTLRIGCECVGPPEVNKEENTQAQAEIDIQEAAEIALAQQEEKCKKAGVGCFAPKRFLAGACYDLAWWAAHKACKRGSCWNLRHQFCEKC